MDLKRAASTTLRSNCNAMREYLRIKETKHLLRLFSHNHESVARSLTRQSEFNPLCAWATLENDHFLRQFLSTYWKSKIFGQFYHLHIIDVTSCMLSVMRATIFTSENFRMKFLFSTNLSFVCNSGSRACQAHFLASV
ncbi:hypothetical protein ROZALSC1DRAFT_25344 [Rozella allomycis CSF55]|uniref:Uncharacterized protein n=1 Tax=Rozella allomycis (strain CSF55) TaxID=988480 RepID=A0A4P9YC10_ROZAC|nr:hypothetical protein ROZALSC1DRAFT_25344 [Rozella allomycis CSF55]